MRRRGDYRHGATAAGDPGVRSLYHAEGREDPKEKNPTPPPRQPSASPRACVVLASCLRHACNEGRTTWAPLPPPHTPAPPRVGDAGRGGAKSAPPPPEDKAAGWGGSGERVRDGPHDRARRGHAPCKPQRGDHRGCERRVERATTGATRHAPPPPLHRDRCRASCLRRACVVPATCVQRREDDNAPPPPHISAPPRVGDEGREGRTAPPPPEDKAARWGGSGERVRDGPHDRARRKHAQCKPQRGGHRGCKRRVGRATTGATRQAPPPPCRGTSAAPRACAVLATCLRQRTDSEGAPPPTPFSPTHPGKGRG